MSPFILFVSVNVLFEDVFSPCVSLKTGAQQILPTGKYMFKRDNQNSTASYKFKRKKVDNHMNFSKLVKKKALLFVLHISFAFFRK